MRGPKLVHLIDILRRTNASIASVWNERLCRLKIAELWKGIPLMEAHFMNRNLVIK